jgi:hypothetical protein
MFSVSDVRQIEIYTSELLVPGSSHLEVEIAIANLREILYRIGKNCLIGGRSLLLYQYTTRAIKLTVVIIVGYYCYQLHTISFQYPSLKLESMHG